MADDGNPGSDVFLRDRQTGKTVLVSVAADGGRATTPATRLRSDDGGIVALLLLRLEPRPGDTITRRTSFVRDMKAGKTTRISLGVGGKQANDRTFVAGLSADGRRVLLASDASNLVAATPTASGTSSS